MVNIQRYRELAKGNKLIFDLLIKPPYNNMIYIFKAAELPNYLEKSGQFSGKDVDALKELYRVIGPALNIDINKTLRLVEIEEDLINLVINTDNNIFHRPLFFPTVFINNDIEYDGAIIKGILISEAIVHGKEHQLIYGDLYEDYGEYANDYEIFYIVADTKYNITTMRLMSLIEPRIRSNLSDQDIRMTNIDNFVRNMIVNIVDMVEGIDKDLLVTIIETTKEQNLKRLGKGQIPFPTKIYIRTQGEFKKFVQKFNSDIQESKENDKMHKISHKFMVRGHWRHFRAERYKRETKARPIWIKPFWKGEGIPIAKEYKLVH